MTGNGLVTVIHAGRPVTVQVQPNWLVTFTAKRAPPAGNVGLLVGEIVVPTQAPGDCETEWATPAMTIDALRAVPLLAATM